MAGARRVLPNTRSPEVRRRVLLLGVLAAAAVTLARSFQLGVLEAATWRAKALDQQGDTIQLPAPRGTIYDRDGMPLAATSEAVSVQVDPQLVTDRNDVAQLLRQHLDLSEREIARALDTRRQWVVLPGRYGIEVTHALSGVDGVHFETVMQRFYPNGGVARELLGPVRLDGKALGGIELEFDDVLNGRSGLAVTRKDSRGRPLPGALMRAIEPTPGRDIYLTIDYDLQEIAEQALDEALTRTNAQRGELLMTDPRTGEVLAAVSRGGDGRARNWRAVTDPYEPGSTLKPFTVAALLSLGRASLADSVYGEEGRDDRLRLTDVHAQGWMTLADALRESSNIGVAKMAERLARPEQYVALRDFGFGTPTGVAYPSESGGRLPRPTNWSATSPSRLAIGYEISVTPLQMAMAYGALANGGELLEPRLVREVRSRDGRSEKHFPPRVVRRVITEEVADAMRGVLVDAVATGSGQRAALGPFEVAGKTGTARIAANGGYRAGAYIASFAGFFPADDPQLVFVVKLDEPKGEYYGGLAAAPVTRATLEAALAARETPLDRSAMAKPAQGATTPQPLPVARSNERATVLLASNRTRTAGRDTVPMQVPDVSGLPMRDGVRRLHAAGFRLRLEGSGRILRTEPAAGGVTDAAHVVRVIAEGAA